MAFDICTVILTVFYHFFESRVMFHPVMLYLFSSKLLNCSQFWKFSAQNFSKLEFLNFLNLNFTTYRMFYIFKMRINASILQQ